MNTLQKFTTTALITGLALGSTASARADVLGFSVSLPDISTVTAEVGKAIAVDLAAHLRNAPKAPRARRTRQSPSVSIEAMETVVVVATRLPSLDQSSEQEMTRTAQAPWQVRL